MNPDIDIGGSGLDDFEDEGDYEDIIPIEEAEVVEAYEEPAALPKAPPPKKEPSKWVKRIIVIVVVIVILIVAMVSFVYFSTEVTDINVSLIRGPETLNATALVSSSGTASVAGEADLEITYNNNQVYSSKISIDDGGTGRLNIPYDKFVVGNGNYYVSVEYKGKESNLAEYKVEYIAEKIEIGLYDVIELGVVNDGGELNGQLNLSVHLRDYRGNLLGDEPKEAQITVNWIKCIDDGGPIITNGDSPVTISDHDYRKEYQFPQAGNYSINVTVVNTRIDPDSNSRYYELEVEWEGFLNILPMAKAVITNRYNNAPPTTYTVEFDAGDSWNDGFITKYIWDFDNDGDIDLETTSPTASYSSYVAGWSYYALLNIEGDIMVWDPIDNEWLIEKGAISIHVNPP